LNEVISHRKGIPCAFSALPAKEFLTGMYNSTLAAKLFNAGSKIINSEYQPLDHLKLFLSRINTEVLVVELGSGNRRLFPQVVNIDLFLCPNVDIVTNIEKIPFSNFK
jgi:hypothetical protein